MNLPEPVVAGYADVYGVSLVNVDAAEGGPGNRPHRQVGEPNLVDEPSGGGNQPSPGQVRP